MKHILFITPKLGRSGSEFYLHNIISSLDKSKYKVSVYSIQNGDFIGSIPNVQYYVLESYLAKQRQTIYSLKNKFLKKTNLEKYYFLEVVDKCKPDLLYINTLAIPSYIELASLYNIPKLLHVHELEQAVFHNKQQNDHICNDIDKIITCSDANKKVIRTLGYKGVLTVLAPAIDLNSIQIKKERSEILNELEFKETDFIWVMSGSTDMNKNPLDFLDCAMRMINFNDTFRFLWIGGDFNSGIGLYVKKRTEELGLSDYIKWVGHINSNEFYCYLNLANCFLLTSQRDSFPLVMIQNAFLGKPIVSYNSGGVKDFINKPTVGVLATEMHTKSLISAALEAHENISSFNSEECKARALMFDMKLHIIKWEQEVNDIIQTHY